MKKFLPAILLVCAFSASGCCTIMGPLQEVSIASTPTGTKVYIDGVEVGRTPFIARLTKKYFHTVKMEMDGYQPYEMFFTRKINGWVAGNFFYGAVIGIAVDALTGCIYKLSPGGVNAVLTKSDAGVNAIQNCFYYSLTLNASPGWQKIGQLAKACKQAVPL